MSELLSAQTVRELLAVAKEFGVQIIEIDGGRIIFAPAGLHASPTNLPRVQKLPTGKDYFDRARAEVEG